MLSKLKVRADGSIAGPSGYFIQITLFWLYEVRSCFLNIVVIEATKLENISAIEQFHWSLTRPLNDAVMVDWRYYIRTDWNWDQPPSSKYLQCSYPLVRIVTEWPPAPRCLVQSDVWFWCVFAPTVCDWVLGKQDRSLFVTLKTWPSKKQPKFLTRDNR